MRLGDVCDIVSGVTLGRKVTEPTTRRVPYLRVANVKDGYVDLSAVYTINVTEREFQRWQLRPGDLLLTEGGDADKLGRGTFWEGQIPDCIHQNHIFRVRLDAVEIEPEFASAQIGSPQGKAYFLAHAKQTTGIATINQKVLAGFPLLYPRLAEQKRVVAILRQQMAAVERARAAAEAQLEAARTLTDAHLDAAFGGVHARAWPRRRLADVSLRITDGTHQSPPFTQGGVPFLFVRNIVSGRIDFDVKEYISCDTYEELTRRCRPERGDVLYSAVGSFGVAVLVDTDRAFAFQRHIAHIKPRREILDARFLVGFINSPEGRRWSDSVALGGAQRTVTLGALANLEIPVPPVSAQEVIARLVDEKLTASSGIRQQAEAQLAAINALPAALLRQAFAGAL